MSEEKQKAECHDYVVEREFLARISITEFISRMIQSHASHALGQEEQTG